MRPKERILVMLEDGKITPDEAARLLEALRNSFSPTKCRVEVTRGRGRRIYKRRFRFPHRFFRRFGEFFGPEKKVVVKVTGECCNDEDFEFLAYGCPD